MAVRAPMLNPPPRRPGAPNDLTRTRERGSVAQGRSGIIFQRVDSVVEQKPLRREIGLTLALFTAAAVVGNSPPVHAQISKGNQILLKRGLQVQGLVTRDDVFHLTTYQN